MTPPDAGPRELPRQTTGEVAAADPAAPAALPGEEHAFSESTVHWLAQGDVLHEAPHANGAASGAHAAVDHRGSRVFDLRAAGRRRDWAVIGGAAVLALVAVLVLRAQSTGGRERAPAPATAASQARSPAEALTREADAELRRGHGPAALALANRALAADPRFADAYVVAGSVHQSAGRNAEARAAYNRYLELAPQGHYAPALRKTLSLLAD